MGAACCTTCNSADVSNRESARASARVTSRLRVEAATCSPRIFGAPSVLPCGLTYAREDVAAGTGRATLVSERNAMDRCSGSEKSTLKVAELAART